MNEFDAQDMQNCIRVLSKATYPLEALASWSCLQDANPHLFAMVALKEWKKPLLPAVLEKYMAEPHNFVVPYFARNSLYFMDDHIFAQMTAGKEVTFGIDYTLTLDTNMVTFVDSMIQGRPLDNVAQEVQLLKDILRDNLNFDGMFYMVENIKTARRQLVRPHDSAFKFWKSLSRGFRKNMVSFQLFRSIDSAAYKSTGVMQPRASYREAVRTAVGHSHDFYACQLGSERIHTLELPQRMLLLHLIGIVRIQLASARSPKNKMKEYFKYVHDVVGAYADREAVIAHKFFCNRNSIGSLEKIKKGGSKLRLLKYLDNIAWDMLAPRFLEKLILSGGEGRYIVPMFVSGDKGLRQMMKAYPVKGALFNRSTGAFAPLPEICAETYFEKHGCASELEYLYSEPVRLERLSRAAPDLLTVHKLIKAEFKKLRGFMA